MCSYMVALLGTSTIGWNYDQKYVRGGLINHLLVPQYL